MVLNLSNLYVPVSIAAIIRICSLAHPSDIKCSLFSDVADSKNYDFDREDDESTPIMPSGRAPMNIPAEHAKQNVSLFS